MGGLCYLMLISAIFPFILAKEWTDHQKQATGNSSKNEQTPKFLFKISDCPLRYFFHKPFRDFFFLKTVEFDLWFKLDL